MRTATRCALALCAAALLSGDLSAQTAESRTQDAAADVGRAADRGAARAEEGATAVQRGAEKQRAAAEKGATARGAKTRNAKAAEHRVLAAELAAAETSHRGRLAKLKRLHALAEKSGNKNQVREIDALKTKSTAHHRERLAKLKERMGKDSHAAMDRVVNRGREASAPNAAERKKALEKWSKDHPGRGHGVAHRGKGMAKDAANAAARGAQDAVRGAKDAIRGHAGDVPTDAQRKAATERERAAKRAAEAAATSGRDGRDG
ncbi:MAG: hypothetical protein ACI9EF_003945 [Pseudohongiellaceae bacterium]|jgi:hypothetical protein